MQGHFGHQNRYYCRQDDVNPNRRQRDFRRSSHGKHSFDIETLQPADLFPFSTPIEALTRRC